MAFATTIALYVLAAALEIAGCFAFWAWRRGAASALWLVPGIASLIGFALVLAATPPDRAGRSYAAYGGIYVAAALLWLTLVEGKRPDRFDLAGAALCAAGAMTVLAGALR